MYMQSVQSNVYLVAARLGIASSPPLVAIAQEGALNSVPVATCGEACNLFRAGIHIPNQQGKQSASSQVYHNATPITCANTCKKPSHVHLYMHSVDTTPGKRATVLNYFDDHDPCHAAAVLSTS